MAERDRQYVDLVFSGAVVERFYRPTNKGTGLPDDKVYAFIKFGGNELRVCIEDMTSVTQGKYSQLPTSVGYQVSAQFAFAYFPPKEGSKFGEQVVYCRNLRIALDNANTQEALKKAHALLA